MSIMSYAAALSLTSSTSNSHVRQIITIGSQVPKSITARQLQVTRGIMQSHHVSATILILRVWLLNAYMQL